MNFFTILLLILNPLTIAIFLLMLHYKEIAETEKAASEKAAAEKAASEKAASEKVAAVKSHLGWRLILTAGGRMSLKFPEGTSKRKVKDVLIALDNPSAWWPGYEDYSIGHPVEWFPLGETHTTWFFSYSDLKQFFDLMVEELELQKEK